MTDLSAEDFALISAVNDRAILAECLQNSPDVVSGDLPLSVVEGARNMASAFNQGMGRSDRRIYVFAHQDVYLPSGWLKAAVAALNRLSETHPDWQVAGPYGVDRQGRHVGRIWDVNLGRELGRAGFPPTPVGSLDELLLILRRDQGYRFDEDLPHFHLYGTDLVQSAWSAGRSAFAVELPVVHNSRPLPSLRGGYAKAYHYARRKWRAKLPIETTVCSLSNNPIPLWHAQWRQRHVRERPDKLLQDAVDVARLAGYE